MTLEIAVVLIILALAVFLFASEKLPIDVVSLTIMAILILVGILTPEEGVAGFSNPATITVAAMFILSAGLAKTGALNIIGVKLGAIIKYNLWLGIFVMMLVVGVFSAFINNTPVVAIFIPIVIGAAIASNHTSSKLLMPLSFASMMGGVTTLIGSSTNLLVSNIAVKNGMRPLGMFELAPLGLIFFAIGIIYMLVIGVRLIPSRRGDADLTKKFGMGDYLAEIELLPGAKSVGKMVSESPLVKELDIDIIEIIRPDVVYHMPQKEVLKANDILRVKCSIERIKTLQERAGIVLRTGKNAMFTKTENHEIVLLEAVIAPNSILEGKTLKEAGFKYNYHSTALAIRHRGATMREKLGSTKLHAGDALLLETMQQNIELLKQRSLTEGNTFVIISEVDLPKYRRKKFMTASLIILSIVLLATFNLVPIMVGALAGCIAMVLTGCVEMKEFYRSIEWNVIFLLAGALSLGAAIEKSGAALLLSNGIISLIGEYGPIAIISVFYLLTTLFTETMSNNATAVLLAPIGIAAAHSLGIDPRPILIAITFAASVSFMTPVGYQTNTMIYGAGQYRFADFLRVGGPLNLLFWILATWLIPIFYPF